MGLLADAPYTAELLHSYTGVLLPVYPALSPYLHTKYASGKDKVVLMLKSSSMSGLAQSGWSADLLDAFAGPDMPIKFHRQLHFMSFEEIAQYCGILYWPGPHGMTNMQFHEMYNMNMPLLMPGRLDLVSSIA